MLNLSKSEIQNTVSLVLTKRNIPNPPKSAVKVFFDTSGSFQYAWNDGTVAMLADRVLAVANRFDDNGELDIFHFNSDVFEVGSAAFDSVDAAKWVNENILKARRNELWRGTEFGPIIEAVRTAPPKKSLLGGLFGRKAAPAAAGPVLVYIVTDGDNMDAAAANSLFAQTENTNLYFMFINVDTLAESAKRYADRYNHVGYVFIPKLRDADDVALVEALVTDEFTTWRGRFPA